MPEANQAVEAFPLTIINPESLPSLLSALANAQGEYKPIKRGKLVEQRLKNKDTGEYTGRAITFYYAELSSILDAVRPALAKHGLSFFQPLHDVDGELYLYTMLGHTEGCVIQSRMRVHAAGDVKAVGAMISYLRRYAASPMLGVSSEDDIDNDGEGHDDDEGNQTPPAERQPRATPQRRSSAPEAASGVTGTVTQGQLKNLLLKIKTSGVSAEALQALLQRLGVPAIAADMSTAHWALVKKEVEKVVV